MPSGARKIEQGLPWIWGNNHSPTASKYSARSRFVTGAPSPASGQSALLGLVMVIPKTATVAEADRRENPCAAWLFSLAFATACEVSVSTSRAGLSLRRPLNDACRTIPSPVHPAYSISATNLGFTQCTSFPPGEAPFAKQGLFVAAA